MYYLVQEGGYMFGLKTIGIILGMVILVGCGGGGTSIKESRCESGNNSGNLKNQYGYFGGNTKFCRYTAARDWGLIDTHGGDVLVLRLLEDGEYLITDGNVILGGDYGVSLDREAINAENMNTIEILKIRKKYYTQNGHKAVDCYEVSGGDRDILMCPYSKDYENIKKISKKISSHNTNMFGLIKR